MGSLKSAAIFDHFHTSFAWNSLHTNSLKFILKSALSYLYTMYILEPIWCKYSIGISLRIFWISVFEHVSWTTKSICIVSRPMFCVNCVISLHASWLFFFQLFAHFFVRFKKRWNDPGYGKNKWNDPGHGKNNWNDPDHGPWKKKNCENAYVTRTYTVKDNVQHSKNPIEHYQNAQHDWGRRCEKRRDRDIVSFIFIVACVR